MAAGSIISVIFGVALLGFAVVDIFVTVFVVGGGAGPQSRRIADWSWRAALSLHDPSSTKSHSLLRAAGPLILILALVVWVAELTVAWALIHVPESFQDPTAASFGDRLVYAGKSVFGRGGNAPELETLDGVWDTVHSVAGLTGVTLVSIGLAYVLPVLAAVSHKRSIAAKVNSLGHSVDEMQAMLDRTGGGQFGQHLIALSTDIAASAENHRAYPVLHYFHSATPHAALAPAVAKLVLLVEDGIPSVEAIDDTILVPLNRSMHDLLGALCDLGLVDYANRNPECGTTSPSDVGIEPLQKSTDGPPPVEWMRAYVQFDGWNWDIAKEPSAAYRGLRNL